MVASLRAYRARRGGHLASRGSFPIGVGVGIGIGVDLPFVFLPATVTAGFDTAPDTDPEKTPRPQSIRSPSANMLPITSGKVN
jgi:hypothetical protein